MDQGTEGTYRNVLWIDPAVRDYQVFVDSVNAHTLAIVYPEPIVTGVERIGFVFEKNGPMAHYLQENTDFLIQLGVKHMDFLACDTLPDWQGFYDRLTGITVGASNNQTGNLRYGGDWLMESTCEDMERVYFTHSIEYYTYLLGQGTFTEPYSIDYSVCTVDNAGIINITVKPSFISPVSTPPNSPANTGNINNIVIRLYNSFDTFITLYTSSISVLASSFSFTYDIKTSSILTQTNNQYRIYILSSLTSSGSDVGFSYQYHSFTYGTIVPIRQDYYATCFFGYFNPSITGPHQFNVSSDNLVQLRLGDKTIYDLRSNGTTLVNLNATTLRVTSDAVQLYNTSTYPILMTYVNTYAINITNLSVQIQNNVSFDGSAKALLGYCTTDKITPGLYCYNLDGEQLRQTTGLTWSSTYNTSILERLDRIYSPTWAFGNISQQTFWNDNANISLVEGPLPITPLNISTIQRENQILSIQGTGIHSNVSVFLDNLPQTTFGLNMNVSIVANFSQVQVIDGFAKSNLYSTFSITSINQSTAIRNSSVDLSGSALNNVSYITIGTANASFSRFSNKLEMSVPDSTQTLQQLTVYDLNGGSAVITPFTIPPLFTLSQLTPSTVVQNGSMTVTGSNFSKISYVVVGTTATIPNRFTTDTIQLSIPTNVVGNVSVTVVDQYNNRNWIDGLTVQEKLTVSSIFPTVAVRGAPLTITGTHFYDLSYVNVGGTKLYNLSYSTTAIQIVQPLASAGNISVGVYDLYNNASVSFTVQSLFSVSSYNPSSVVPQTVLQVKGTNFSNLSHVQFGMIPMNPLTYTDVTVNVSVPVGLADNVSVTVVDIYGNSSSISPNLTVLNLKYESVLPSAAVERTPLTLTGDNLSNVSYVVFGNLSTSPTSVAKTTVQVTVPPNVSLITSIMLQDVYGNQLNVPFTTVTLFSVSGFNPSSLKPQRALTITGANFSNLSYVQFGDKTVQPFESTETTINVSVPTGLGLHVPVTVYNRFSTGKFVGNLSVLNLSFESISPSNAVFGTPLTLSGFNFYDLSYVSIGTKVYLPDFSYTSTQITLNNPSILSGNVSVEIGDIYQNNASLSFTVLPLFSLSRYSPSSAIPQTVVQIKGSNLSNLSHVQFGDSFVNPLEVTSTYVNVSVPTGLPNTVSVTVMDLFGNSSSLLTNLSILNLSIGSIQPVQAVQRAPLTITGTNLNNTSYVVFANVSQQVVSKNDTTVVVKVPDNVNTTYATLYDVYNNNLSVNFSVNALFSVTSFSPSSRVPNAPLQIQGTHFANLSSIYFGTVETHDFTYTVSTIQVSVPTNASGNVSIFVYDEYTNVQSLSGLNISSKLVLTSITSVVYGAQAILSGNHFYDISRVNVGGTLANFSYDTTTIRFTQPLLNAGNVSVGIYDLYGNNASISFIVQPLFSLAQYNPSSVIPQRELQIKGSNFSNLSFVRFGTLAVNSISYNSDTLQVLAPVGVANNVSVTVVDLYGNSSSLSTNLSVLNLQVNSILPATAVEGTPFTIVGDNLENVSQVRFGNMSVIPYSPSKQQIRATVPVGAPLGNTLTIADLYGNTLSYPFTTVVPFSLSGYNPSSVIPRTILQIQGANFANMSYVMFGVKKSLVLNTTVDQIEVEVPTGLPSSVSIRVHDRFITNRTLPAISILNLSLESVNPLTAVQEAPLSVKGINILDLSYVDFGGITLSLPHPRVSYSSTELLLKIPPHEIGNVSIVLGDRYGNSESIEFTMAPLFSVTSFIPESHVPRAPIQILGTNLSNLSYVQFGSEKITSFTYDQERINLSVPRLLGNVSVTVVDIYSNPVNVPPLFEVLPIVAPTTFSPIQATLGTPLTFQGSNFSNLSYLSFKDDLVETILPISSYTDTSFSLTIPSFIPGALKATLYDIHGNFSTYPESFTYYNPFTLSHLNPSGSAQRSRITLLGERIYDLDRIEFGNLSTRDFTNSSVSIQVTVPDSTQASCAITVYDRFGNVKSLTPFSYTNPSLDPHSYNGQTNMPFSITGKYLADTSYVMVGDLRVEPTLREENKVSFTIPHGTGTTITTYDIYNTSSTVPFAYRNISAFSVDPSGATTNWILTVSGENLTRVTETYMRGIPVTSLKTDSALSFPAVAGEGNASIYLKDAYGNVTRVDTFQYRNPTVSHYNIYKGRTRQVLTIYGTYLEYTDHVLFGDKPNLDNVERYNTYLKVVVPENNGNVSLFVVDICGNSLRCADSFLCMGGNASLFGLSPNRGTNNTSVTLLGENLGYSAVVQFGSQPAPLNVNNPSFLNVSAPPGDNPPGLSGVNITVIDIADSTVEYSYGNFTYENPTIHAMVPSEGPIGVPVSLQGKFLSTTTMLSFHNSPLTFTPGSTEVSFVAPNGSTNASVYLLDHLGNRSYTTPFVYRNPRIDSINPSKGPPNVPIEIRGINLLNTSFLYFGNHPNPSSNTIVNLSSWSLSTVVARVPPGTGNVSVYVIDRYGNTNETSFMYQYPLVSEAAPLVGPPTLTLDVSGVYLENLTRVYFEGVPSTQIDVTDSRKVRVKVPPHPDGEAAVLGYDAYDNPVPFPSYTYQNPILRNLNSYSNVSGSTITLTGSYLFDTSYIRLGPFPVQNFSYRASDPLEFLYLTVPPGTGNVSISAYDIYDNVASIQTFTYIYPLIRTIDLSACVIGREVILQGDYLERSQSIYFGTASTPFSYSNGSIRTTVPDGSGNVAITVYDIYQNPASISFKYLFPTITTLRPSSGPSEQVIYFIGQNLENTSYVVFGNTSSRDLTYANGSVRMRVPDGSGNVVVTLYDIYGNPANSSYLYRDARLEGVFPNAALPNASVFLRGDLLEFVTRLEIMNLNETITLIPSLVGEELTFRTPMIYGNLELKAYSKNKKESNKVSFTVLDPAFYDIRIDEQTATEGVAGSYVYIYGLNLVNISRVTFGTKEADFKILSNYHIRLTVPPIQSTSRITLLTPYASYEADLFTPIFPSLATSSLTGKIDQRLIIEGENLEIVAVQFAEVSRLRTFSLPTMVDATLLSSTPTQVEIIVPYGHVDQTVYLYDINRRSLTVPFQYILPEPVRVDTRDTSGITQDYNRNLYSWLSSRVDYPTGSYSGPVYQAVVDTQTLYISNRTTEITRFRIDSRVTLRPFVTPTPVEYIFLDRLLYMVSGTTLYVCDVSRGTISSYEMPRTYTGLAVWKNMIYGTDGTTLYEVSLDPVSDTEFSLFEVRGQIKQILVVNDRLFILSDNMVQYNLYGKVEYTLEMYYTSMAYSYTSLLLSNNSWIDQIPLPPVTPSEFRWGSCNVTTGTQNTLITMKGVMLDQIAHIHFDHSPALIRLTTPTTLLFQVPKGTGSPKIELLDDRYNRLPHGFVFEYQNTEFTCSLPKEGRPGTHLYLFGENLDQVEEAYIGSFRVNPVLIRKNTLRIIAPDSDGVQFITLIDRDKNVISPGLTFSYVTVHSSICFPKDTLIYSDQGAIEIQKLIPGTHTIYGKDIVAITATQYIEETMVAFDPGSMGPHIPERLTVMTNKHKVFVHGKMMEARRLVGRPGIYSIPYEGYRVYNVLLTTEGRMNVQGLLCETLDPTNPMAALFTPEECPL